MAFEFNPNMFYGNAYRDNSTPADDYFHSEPSGKMLFDTDVEVQGTKYTVFRECKHEVIEIFYTNDGTGMNIRDMLPPALAAEIIETARAQKQN